LSTVQTSTQPNGMVIKKHSQLAEVKKRLRKSAELYLIFLLPFLWFVIFRYGPMYGLQIAFRDYRAVDGIWGSEWIGLFNFTKFFSSYVFERVVTNTIGITVYNLVVGFPIPIILALALNTSYRGKFKKVTQYVTYMPYFISTVVMVGIVMQFLNPRIGIINKAIVALGGEATDFMAKPELFKSIYVWSGIWQHTGWNSIIYLATLSSIPQELHEAAMIDGASRFKRILHIDLPGIMPTAIILLIMNCGRLMSVGFEKIFLMQNPLNLRTSQVISTYEYSVGLKSAAADFSYATAIGLFNSVINMVFIVVVNKIAKKTTETSLW
jgi:putative aldouronate transport system permease protein